MNNISLVSKKNMWFGLFELLLAFSAGLWWFIQPTILFWPVLLIGSSLLFHWIRRKPEFPGLQFIIPMTLFLVSAGIGVWAAYDPENAWAKFWPLLGSVLLFILLYTKEREDLWQLTRILTGYVLIVSVVFLMTHDFSVAFSGFRPLNWLTGSWNNLRPSFFTQFYPTESAAGLFMLLIPPVLALFLRAVLIKNRFDLIFTIVSGSLAAFAFLMTGETAAMMILFVIVGSWIVLGLYNRSGQKWSTYNNTLRVSVLLLLVLVVTGVNFSGLLNGIIADYFPKLLSRIDITSKSINLVPEYGIIGGGLGSFSGLYSRYILVIPYLFSVHSHNLWVNILVEMGALGLLPVLFIMALTFIAAFWQRIKPDEHFNNNHFGYLQSALFASLIGIHLFSLIDDPFYSPINIYLLFFIPGFTGALLKIRRSSNESDQLPALKNNRKWVLLLLAGFFMLALIIFQDTIRMTLRGNFAAIQMSKMELTGWPEKRWEDCCQAEDYSDVREEYLTIVEKDTENFSANYRLGLIADHAGEYTQAVLYYERALKNIPAHYGVRKSLGLAYVWLGQYENAVALLETIPGSADELRTYSWWWGTQGNQEYERSAARVAEMLE